MRGYRRDPLIIMAKQKCCTKNRVARKPRSKASRTIRSCLNGVAPPSGSWGGGGGKPTGVKRHYVGWPSLYASKVASFVMRVVRPGPSSRNSRICLLLATTFPRHLIRGDVMRLSIFGGVEWASTAVSATLDIGGALCIKFISNFTIHLGHHVAKS